VDQADDARITDPMLDKADQPTLADFVEGSVDTLPISTVIRIM